MSRRVVYTDAYLVDIGTHVFPTEKYRMIRDLLVEHDGFRKGDFVQPSPARDEDILLVHTRDYLEKLRKGTLSPEEQMRLELPYSKELADASFLCCDGSIRAAQHALEDRVGLHIGGGFHHAFPDHGEGFCVFNDIAVAIRRLQKDGRIKRAMVVDCDLHHGNGTAFIFRGDRDVFTFSIHQQDNYPFVKPPGTLDVGLEDGSGDTQYLEALQKHVPDAVRDFKPELIMYVAGADPYKEDQIGGLSLTMEGLRERDKFVFETASTNRIPVCVVLAGGYAIKKEDTARIHYTTIRTGLGYAK